MNYKISGEFGFTAKQFEDALKAKNINISGCQVNGNILDFDLDEALKLSEASEVYQTILSLNAGESM